MPKGLAIRMVLLVIAVGIWITIPRPPQFVTGTVVKVSYSHSTLEESSGAIFGNESVRINQPIYIYCKLKLMKIFIQ